ncbi:hypothetical protein ACUXCC_003006 [Cytobacillus horneckiae]
MKSEKTIKSPFTQKEERRDFHLYRPLFSLLIFGFASSEFGTGQNICWLPRLRRVSPSTSLDKKINENICIV